MEIKNQANWLRGYLESLLNSDNISKKQIQVLLTKIEELVSALDDHDDDDDEHNNNEQEDSSPATSFSDHEPIADDLPF